MRTQKTTIVALIAGLVLMTVASTASAQNSMPQWQNGSSPDRRVFESTETGLKLIGTGVVGPIVTGDPSLVAAVPAGVIVTPLGLVDDVVHMPETVPPAVGRAAELPKKAFERIIVLPHQAVERVDSFIYQCR